MGVDNILVTAVPEPSPFALLSMGLIAGARTRRPKSTRTEETMRWASGS